MLWGMYIFNFSDGLSNNYVHDRVIDIGVKKWIVTENSGVSLLDK